MKSNVKDIFKVYAKLNVYSRIKIHAASIIYMCVWEKEKNEQQKSATSQLNGV